MDCVCGVCTVSCAESAVCQALVPSAVCVSPIDRSQSATCLDYPTSSFCDLACTTDEDCGVLSPSYHCTGGFCRTATNFTDTDAGADAGVCPNARVAGNEVVVLGDLFVAQSHEITAYLEEMAREAGKLAIGERFRDYGGGGSDVVVDTCSTTSGSDWVTRNGWLHCHRWHQKCCNGDQRWRDYSWW